jgi:hypothetical protein
MRQVVLYPGEDGYWVAECPSLPGCVTQGKTKEEAVANVREAIAAPLFRGFTSAAPLKRASRTGRNRI